MKIGRTNAITISGGGTTKSPYDEWQEGFGANWDSVIQNAPQTGVNPVLHVYSKVNSIRHMSGFTTTATIVTYNPTTGIYRPVVVDANKNLFFEESDFFINNNDGMYYTCVIYKALISWGDYHFKTYLPVVYSNTKNSLDDMYVNLINVGGGQTFALYPYLRGVDCYKTSYIQIGNSLEHLTFQSYDPTIQIVRIAGSDTQLRVLKSIVDNAPIGTTITLWVAFVQTVLLYISDEKLADWFYNDLCYNNFSGVSYQSGFPISNVVKTFKIRPDINFYSNYLSLLPNMVYIDGIITEDQTKIADTYAGFHNFRNSGWTMLQNFPMWAVLEGATTGCLLPRPYGSTANQYANFVFYSKNLERKYFCEFDENGTIIEDPTKYFLCNLPVQQHVSGQSVRFVTNTFWSLFTADEISEIERYIGLKNWGIIWQ